MANGSVDPRSHAPNKLVMGVAVGLQEEGFELPWLLVTMVTTVY